MKQLETAPESLFWYWINERHRIWVMRTSLQPKPWTNDPILREFKFTNVFRQLDRGTEWLTLNFIAPHRFDRLDLLAFNIAWYRMFNWTGTGKLLGWRRSWQPTAIRRRLKAEKAKGRQVFTGAHIIWGEKGLDKIDGVLLSCQALWNDRENIAKQARFSRSLEHTFNVLTTIRGVGAFMGYEIVSDYRHTRLLEDAHDINTWANVGPGALRGLKRLDPAANRTDGLKRMRELLAKSQTARAKWVPELELRDIEHSLCEFDKYCRVKYGEGHPRSRYNGEAEKDSHDHIQRPKRPSSTSSRAEISEG